MENKKTDVSIVFVNYKTKDLTTNAIKSVIEKTEGLNYEIFVVDNDSQDGSIEAIEQEFPNINIIKNSVNAGFGTANNLAIRQANGKYIFCLNTDTLLINNAIKIMFNFMELNENKTVGVCGGYLQDSEGKPCIMGGHLPSIQEVLLKFDFLKILKPLHKKYAVNLNSEEAVNCKTINSITGADIFFRKTALDEAGLFDERIFMYYEDADLCKRISDKGFKVKYIPNAKIVHLEGKSCINSLNKTKMAKKGQFIYFCKHHKSKIIVLKILYELLYLINYIYKKDNYSKQMLDFVRKFNYKDLIN